MDDMTTQISEVTQTTSIIRRVNDPQVPPCPRMARELLRRGTPRAIDGVIASLDDCIGHEAWHEVIDMLADETAVPDSRFEELLDSRRTGYALREAAALILSRRGVARGHEVLFDEFPARALVDRFVQHGPEGIRTMCRAIRPGEGDGMQIVSDRLASLRRSVESTVYELADAAGSGGDHVAVFVLGHWDDPRSIDTLLHIADDPTRRRAVRQDAVDVLCKLEAPEAIGVIGRAMLDPTRSETDREHYAWVLGEIGNFAALEHLEEAVRLYPDSGVSGSARAAIERIQGGGE